MTGGTVLLPPGRYLISDSLLIDQQAMRLVGSGPSTVLKWAGDAGETMIDIRDSSRVTISDMTILGDDTAPPSEAIHFYAPSTPTVGTNEWSNVSRVMVGREWATQSSPDGELAYGIRVSGATGNNDTFSFSGCQFFDCTTAGVSLENEQVRWNLMTDLAFVSCATGFYCRGNTKAINLHFVRSTIDIDVDDCRLQIFGYESEHAAKLWDQGFGSALMVIGGQGQLQAEMTGQTYWSESSVSNGAMLTVVDFQVVDQVASGAKLFITGSSSNTDPSSVLVRNCLLPDGDSDDGYVVNGYGSGTPLHIDIEQGDYTRYQTVQSLAATQHTGAKGVSRGTGNTIGFYGTTPIAQQTGVAVSAAAIHAALVDLGLITA
ncbi:MAG: hypothetical protein GY701_20140 [Sulfitobacter sp.]|nr:hypothetical protein [Sulfitobacter sp.]